MELGEKLRQARLEAGLSQRQLCAEEITRNMLSQIEHGAARPSMKTLQYLAGRLGKSVSYFLDEPNPASPNQELIFSARECYDQGRWEETARLLEDYAAPDALFDREAALLQSLTYLQLAEAAIREERNPYALELLEKARVPAAYCREALERRRLLLLGQLPGQIVSARLPSLDAELLLRAEEALENQNATRAAGLLCAVENTGSQKYHLLQGEVCLRRKDYAQAAEHFLQAEDRKQTAPKLEQCYRELGDYKKAYEYACLQRP